jgi:hypothetical protein
MVCVGGQGNYELAARLLGRMRRLQEGRGETAQHTAYLDDLKSRHKARRNSIKLSGAGGV